MLSKYYSDLLSYTLLEQGVEYFYIQAVSHKPALNLDRLTITNTVFLTYIQGSFIEKSVSLQSRLLIPPKMKKEIHRLSRYYCFHRNNKQLFPDSCCLQFNQCCPCLFTKDGGLKWKKSVSEEKPTNHSQKATGSCV